MTDAGKNPIHRQSGLAVTAPFDPYHKWFGIPQKDQPPNHYRLLGLDLYESDPDVIDAATEQRVSFLRQCGTGQHVAESQQLLNEVAAARLCLLNGERKREYDAKLQAAPAPAAHAAGTVSAADSMPAGADTVGPPRSARPPDIPNRPLLPLPKPPLPPARPEITVKATPPERVRPGTDEVDGTRVWSVRAGELADTVRVRLLAVSKQTWMAVGIGVVVLGILIGMILWMQVPPESKQSVVTQPPKSGGATPGVSADRPPLANVESADPLVIAPIEDKTLSVGELLVFHVTATTVRGSTVPVTFDLGPDAPAGALIGESTGELWWMVTGVHAGKTIPIAVRVTADADKPADLRRSAVCRFNVTVKPGPPHLKTPDSGTGAAAKGAEPVPARTFTLVPSPSTANSTAQKSAPAIGSTPTPVTQATPRPVRLVLHPLLPLSINAGETKLLAVRVERENSVAEIRLQLQGLPPAVRVKGGTVTIPRSVNQTSVELVADSSANTASSDVQVIASLENVSQTRQFRLTVVRPVVSKPAASKPAVPKPAVVKPAASKPSASKVVFDDDFNDPAKSSIKLWAGSRDNLRQAYENGRYVVQLQPGKVMFGGSTFGEPVSNFDCTARFLVMNSAPSVAVSISFRDDVPKSPQQTTQLQCFLNSEPKSTFVRQMFDATTSAPNRTVDELVPWRDIVLKPGWNLLHVKAQGPQVEVTINGSALYRGQVGGRGYVPAARSVAIWLTKYAEGDQGRLEFDEVRVTRIGKQ